MPYSYYYYEIEQAAQDIPETSSLETASDTTTSNEISTLPKEPTYGPTLSPTMAISITDSVNTEKPSLYKKIYQSIFGPEGPTSIEVDIVLLAIIVIFGCLCCGVLCWCG
eukprot:TRINITY_DN28803_c0_g1_i1.p1 TRINITY_DN28803_c0_g1~~TRINITY_DN28803_c0_g1_i1.p1  ORF type:complete len:110 (-),score=15.20 TRINITY_DN28803_c0_g1_i1:10-339(-)